MNTLLLVDGHNFINRANHFGAGLTNRKGFPTGVITKTIGMIAGDARIVDATHVCVVFDHSAGCDKMQRYAFYKLNRRNKVDDGSRTDMRRQINPLISILRAAGIRVVRKKNREGDEVINTMAQQFVELYGPKAKVYMATNDKDMAQCVNKQIAILKPDKRILDVAGVTKEYGVTPNKIIEYLMLLGDKVDNIPGVDKCGPKTAADWLNKYGSIEGVLAHKKELTPKLRSNLEQAAKAFKATRWLITLRDNIDVGNSFTREFDEDTLDDLCREYDLASTRKTLIALAKRTGSFK